MAQKQAAGGASPPPPPPPPTSSSQPLHNFGLPPDGLKWGHQRNLRCVKAHLPPHRNASERNPDHRRQPPNNEDEKVVNNNHSMPWNLRARTPMGTAAVGSSAMLLSWLSGMAAEDGGVGGGGRPKFSVALSKEEIEEDFIAMTGKKPPRKPHIRRPKATQRQLNVLLPGQWLEGVKPENYEIPKVKGNHKAQSESE